MKSALARIGTKIDELIASHSRDLESAWANVGEGSLTINFPVKIGMNKNGKQICEVGINFVVEKCQDSESFEWDDRQLSIFRPLDKMAESMGEGESMTISTQGHEPITIKGKENGGK